MVLGMMSKFQTPIGAKQFQNNEKKSSSPSKRYSVQDTVCLLNRIRNSTKTEKAIMHRSLPNSLDDGFDD